MVLDNQQQQVVVAATTSVYNQPGPIPAALVDPNMTITTTTTTATATTTTTTAQLAVQAIAEMDGLSYEEYFKKVSLMIADLKEHWKSEQRVKALKVAIQLSKLLADTGQMKLYAKKYKMITDTLDEFGRLIYIRIHSKAQGQEDDDHDKQRQESGQQTKSSRVQSEDNDLVLSTYREKAKETCRNWFMKVASIRELVPRFYIEVAILKTCDTLLGPTVATTTSGVVTINEKLFYSQSLRRLTKSAWGFGDPIVAIHARIYLCRVAEGLIGWDGINDDNAAAAAAAAANNNSVNSPSELLFELLLMNLEASATLTSQLDTRNLLRTLQKQNIDSNIFFDLLSNGLQILINFLTLNNDIYTGNGDHLIESAKIKLESMFNSLMLNVNKENCSIFARSIILHATTRALPGDIIANHSGELLNAIQTTHKRWQQIRDQVETNVKSPPYDTINDTFEVRKQICSIIASSLYAPIDSFALALDGSDNFELNSDARVKIYTLDSIDTILEDLFDYEMSVVGTTSTSTTTTNDSRRLGGAAGGGSTNCMLLSIPYLRSLKAWISYANHYNEDQDQVDLLLNKFVFRVKRNRQYVSQYHSIIVDLIKTLLANKRTIDEFRQVFGLKSFLQLLELLRKDDHKFEASKWILETMRANLKLNKQQQQQQGSVKIVDKLMINFTLRLCSTLNDSLSLLAANDDLEHLSQLVIYFIDKIQIQDYKEKLDFYSRCRSSLCNLNPILEYLARQSLLLANEFYQMKERKRNLRRNFLNGCLAFAFVTIPAINEPLIRLDLFIEGSRLALNRMSLSLADYYLKQSLLNLTEQLGTQFGAGSHTTHTIISDTNYISNNHMPQPPPTSITNEINNTTTVMNKVKISKLLLDQVNHLLKLMLEFEDHIDLKHKLVLTDVIRNSPLSENSSLFENIKLLKIIDDEVTAVES